MSGHRERRSDGWERRRQASVLPYRLGALVTAATLAAGFFGASSASGAEFQASRASNVAPIGGANPCDTPTNSLDPRIEVAKSKVAHPGETVESELSVFSCISKSLANYQVILAARYNGSLGQFIFPRGERPIATGSGTVWPDKEHPSYYETIEWFLVDATSDNPEELKLKLITPANLLGKFCLDAVLLGPSVVKEFGICWNVPKTLQKPAKAKVVKPSSPNPKAFTNAPKDYKYKSGGKKILANSFR